MPRESELPGTGMQFQGSELQGTRGAALGLLCDSKEEFTSSPASLHRSDLSTFCLGQLELSIGPGV